MKFLIVGLGNPGPDYLYTRHNVGFQQLDFLAGKVKANWASDRFGMRCDLKIKGRSLVLLKPDTYMNLSGKAVLFWMNKLKLVPQQVLVVLDEIHLPLGKLRLRKEGSDGGHNGLKSIEQMLETRAYPRMRIGIGKDFPKGRQSEYVLGAWTKDEQKEMEDVFGRGSEGILQFALAGIDKAMSLVN
ncbi:MAG TPA: aminoacyl-tRNA hydrolase [Saprospiraceae bacterium]|nr:aminoacyl-tRNA hydrolase [Saprospiraceae bacterium]HNT21869.1 aminoacyl-tRNA hydrolase [Saprospiraceae bacterium]